MSRGEDRWDFLMLLILLLLLLLHLLLLPGVVSCLQLERKYPQQGISSQFTVEEEEEEEEAEKEDE